MEKKDHGGHYSLELVSKDELEIIQKSLTLFIRETQNEEAKEILKVLQELQDRDKGKFRPSI